MEIERRERDPDTGEIAPSEASLIGEGFGDVFGKIVAKLTGKTAKKLATKAAEKLVEKGAEKVGEKTGQLVGEKIYDKFSTKRPAEASERSERREAGPKGADGPGPSEPMRAEFPSEAPQTKGKEIGKMLAAASKPTPPEKNKFQKIKNFFFADLL